MTRRSSLLLVLLLVVLAAAGVARASAPSNDDFANATLIASLPFHEDGSLAGATTEPGEPSPCKAGTPTGSAWYRFAPAADVGIDPAPNPGSGDQDHGYTTTMTVYSGTDLAHLEELGCGFRDFGFKARAGRTYYFQLQLTSPPELGTYSFDVPEIPIAANDDISAATVVSSVPFDDKPVMFGTGLEPGETRGCGPREGSVWYRYDDTTGTEDLIVNLTESHDPGPFAQVYVGDDGPSDLLGCSNSFGGPVGFRAFRGQRYWIQITAPDAHYSFQGPVSMEIAHGRTYDGPRDPIFGAPVFTIAMQEDGRHEGAGVYNNEGFDYVTVFADAQKPRAGACVLVYPVSLDLDHYCAATP